jgi:ABC-2 type transport system permease protein
VTTQRETGVLKRRRATPVPAIALIGGRALTAIAVSLATVAAVCALEAAGFGELALCAAIALSTAIAAKTISAVGLRRGRTRALRL